LAFDLDLGRHAVTILLNLADVPKVDTAELGIPMRMLIEKGQGLALLKGLSEREIRELEDDIWAEFEGSDEARLAVALRFRALLDVFAARRLKSLLLDHGFKLIAAAITEASRQPLNTRFGFNAQKLLMALDAATARPVMDVAETLPFQIAA
jgi:hypothetical protein